MPIISITPPASPSPVSISLDTLKRSDTNTTPAGTSLPIAFVNVGGGVWTATFTDTGTPSPAWYFYNATIFTLVTTTSSNGSIQGVGSPATGIYTNQTAMEQLQGVPNISEWSNVNASDSGTSVANIQNAIDRIDVLINYTAQYYGYATPITAASCITYLQEVACDLAICELYLKRGIRDTAAGGYGQFQQRRAEALSSLRRIFKNRINDAGRLVKVAPFVEIDPNLWPIGITPTFLAGFPALVP